MSDMEISSILSPAAEPARPSIEQPTEGDDSKNDMTTTSTTTAVRNQTATAPAEEPQTSKSREDTPRAHTADCKPQPEQTKDAPHASNQTTTNNSTHPTPDPHDQALTIQALRQQLYIAEHHIQYIRNEAGRHIWELEHLARTTCDRSAHLEANVTYLVAEVEKANTYNSTLSEHVRALNKDAQNRETQYRAALQSAQQQQASAAAAAASSSKKPAPTLPLPMQDSTTLLAHNRTTIRSLRAEIRDLKASKTKLQKRLLELSSAPAVDGKVFLQRTGAGLPKEVLSEWSQVLLGRDREIAGLGVMIERERGERAKLEQEKCSKCEPVVVVDDEESE